MGFVTSDEETNLSAAHQQLRNAYQTILKVAASDPLSYTYTYDVVFINRRKEIFEKIRSYSE